MQLGIDLGGTTINMGLVDKGILTESLTGPSFEKNASLAQTVDHLESFISKFFRPGVEGIGIGVPSVVDIEKGIVYDTANIPSWKEVHLKERLEGTFNVPVSVNNDANCFALGAADVCGYTRPDKILVGVTLGTGVGIGIVNGGRLINGANAGAGELSWLPYKNGTLEQWTSKQFFAERGESPRDLCTRASAGDTHALAVMAEFGTHLAVLANLVVSAYDPDIIVFGGGIANCHPFFDSSMKAAMRAVFPFPKSLEKLRIEYLPQSEVAVKGAAML